MMGTMNLMLKMNSSLMFAAVAKLRRLFAVVQQRYKDFACVPWLQTFHVGTLL